MVPAVGQTMQFGDNYLDGHLPFEVPRIDGRDSFNSMSQWSLAMSFDVPDATSPMTTYVVVVHGGWLSVISGIAETSCGYS